MEGAGVKKPSAEADLNEKGNKACYSLEFSMTFSFTAASSQSCDKTLKGREAKENPRQSNEGVAQKLNTCRTHGATRN